jgi:hypothetical protein
MTPRAFRTVALLVALAAAGGACDPQDEKVFKEGGGEQKPPRSLNVGPEDKALGNADATPASPSVAADVKYALTVSTTSVKGLCKGEINVRIMTDFTIQFPDATLQCLSLTFDIGKVLAAGAGAGGTSTEGDKHDGKVFYKKSIGGATFDPPRPFLLGPVVQDVSIFDGFHQTTDHRLSGSDGSKDYNARGSFAIDVLDMKTTYSNNFLKEPFDQVLHWRIKASGFDGVPAKVGLAFQSWEWLWNVRPIMIPRFVIVGDLKDFVTGGSIGDAGSLIVGTMTIEADVKEYTIRK